MKTPWLTISLMLLAACARHDHQRIGELTLSAPWARETPAAANVAAGYLTIKNVGDEDERLLKVESSAADHVEIHTMHMDGDVMRMREARNGLPIPAGQSVVLAPGGSHLMFIAPARPFVAGERVQATLVFQKAGRAPVAFEVRGIATKQAGNMHDHH